MAGALCYGELGARLPRAGGEYAFLRASFGPAVAFLSGWVSLVVGFSAPIAAAAVGAAAYLLHAGGVPNEPFWQAWGVVISPESLLVLGLVGALSLVHTRRLGLSLGVQNLLTLFKLLVLALIIVAGLWLWPAAEPWGAPAGTGGGGYATAKAVGVALVLVSFAYSGFNAAAYLGGEVARPARNLPWAMLLGTGLVILLYLLLNLAYLAALGPKGMPGVKEIGALAAQALWGPGAGRLFSLAVGVCLLSGLGAMVLAGPRVYYAMARDGLLVGPLARIHPRRGVPANAVWLQALIAGGMVLTTTFQALLFYIGFTLALFSALAVAGLMVLRRRDQDPPPFRTPGYPLTPLVFIAASLAMVIFALADNPWRGLPSALTLAVGWGLYLAFSRGHSPRT